MPTAVSSSFDVAFWFIDRGRADRQQLSSLKLQRMLFLAQAYFAASTRGERLMPSVFVATEQGPVEPNLLRLFDNTVPAIETATPRAAVVKFLDGIWRTFGARTLAQLDEIVISSPPVRDAMKAGAEVALPGNAVLHGEPLGDDVFLAPGGRIHTLEDVAQSPATISPRQAAALYRDVLTPRECEVVALIFEGHPTFTIAQHLGLSVGTVKNHRRRLYGKLDITTERELFLLYIEALSRIDGTA